MKNFLNRMSAKRWLFTLTIFLVVYILCMLDTYSDEKRQIMKESMRNFGGDISANLGLFEVLKSGGFDYWLATYEMFFRVFIPYLVISAFFFDYKYEAHVGWRRVFIAAQILVPTIVALFFTLWERTNNSYLFVLLCILFFGWAEFVVLILIKTYIWVREGFAKPAN